MGDTAKPDSQREGAPAAQPGTVQQNLYQIGTQLSGAYYNLSQSLFEANMQNSSEMSQAAHAFATARQDLERETAERASEAYSQYVKAAQEAVTKENSQQSLAEAYQNYATTVAGLQQDSSRRLQELHETLVNKSTEVRKNVCNTARQQYVNYLKSVRNIWSTLDVDALVP
jgi:hypothetical protein